jgi:hypothetical protein
LTWYHLLLLLLLLRLEVPSLLLLLLLHGCLQVGPPRQQYLPSVAVLLLWGLLQM